MKSGIYSVKRVLISENKNLAMKDNRYINKLSKIKKLVQDHHHSPYKKHILKVIFTLILKLEESSIGLSSFTNLMRVEHWMEI